MWKQNILSKCLCNCKNRVRLKIKRTKLKEYFHKSSSLEGLQEKRKHFQRKLSIKYILDVLNLGNKNQAFCCHFHGNYKKQDFLCRSINNLPGWASPLWRFGVFHHIRNQSREQTRCFFQVDIIHLRREKTQSLEFVLQMNFTHTRAGRHQLKPRAASVFKKSLRFLHSLVHSICTTTEKVEESTCRQI